MYTTSNQWVLVGLTSYGKGCARPSAAGVYTRVAYFQSWISSTTSNAFTNAASSDSANVDPYVNTTSSGGLAITRLSASSFALGIMHAYMIPFLLS